MVEQVTDRLEKKRDDIMIQGDYTTSQIVVSPTLFKILIDQYKDPIGSIVREITSNAIDATNEANVDKPVIVTLTHSKFIVEDFGVGISPERVHNYFDFNKSTKRNSVNQIGMFGLGAKCVFSYRDDLTIRTRYNKKEYNYLQFIDEMGMPSYKLISTKNTSKPNGTKIEIDIKTNYDIRLFSKNIKNLIYAKMVYIDDRTRNNNINDIKLYQYKTFMLKNNNEKTYNYDEPFIIYNGIVYPLDLDQLYDNTYVNEPKIIKNLPIGIIINGDKLSLVPSRDNFKYDNTTKKILLDTIKLVVSELNDIYSKQFAFNNINGFVELVMAVHISNNYITLGGTEYRYYLDKTINTNINIKELNPINLNKLKSCYKEPLLFNIKQVFFSSDYRGIQEKFYMSNFDKKNIFIKTDHAKFKIDVNKQIYNFKKKEKKKIRYIKLKSTHDSDTSSNLLNECLLKYYNKTDSEKIITYIKKIEKEFYDSIEKSYNDYYKKIYKQPNSLKINKERTIGNIYVLDQESVKRQFDLKTYIFEPTDNYIFATNGSYQQLKQFKNRIDKTLINNSQIKFAVFSKLFLKKLLKNNVKINYVYIEDLKNYMEDKKNIKNKIYKFISYICTREYVKSNLDNRIKHFDSYSNKNYYYDAFTNDPVIKDMLHKTLSGRYNYYSINSLLTNFNVQCEDIIDPYLTKILLDFTNFFSTYIELDTKDILIMYSNTLKDKDKYKNILSLNKKNITK